MRVFALVWLLLVAWPSLASAVPPPAAVAILYNSAVPESCKLAETYREARGIPLENMLALELPTTADISRADYDQKILKPLRAEFDRRGWWQRARDGNGLILPVMNRIRVLVTMRGVPLRIQAIPKPPPPKPATPPATPPAPVSYTHLTLPTILRV